MNTTKNLDNFLVKKLWAAADALRGNISSEQYMLIIIGILFLKYSSDKYNQAVHKIKKDHTSNWKRFYQDRNILSSDYNCSFIIPEKASWKYLSEYVSQNSIGEKIDEAFLIIEEHNKELKGLFDKNYNRPELDQYKLGQVVAIFADIDLNQYGEDIVGRIYEYFLGHFFKKQGQKGGEFYTPSSIVALLVELIQPDKGKIYDPACGTGGMFIQSRNYLLKNKINPVDLVVYGQEYQNKVWKLAQINLLLHNFNSWNLHLGSSSADTFTNDQHKNSTFDYVLANPPFNMKKWGREKLLEDGRWKWGLPPKGNANYAWLSNILAKLTSQGKAGIVLANGSLTGQRKEEFNIRKNFIKNNKVEAIVTLPEKLFYTVSIPACLWILNNHKINTDVLMINANSLEGKMLSKKLRELTQIDIIRISNLYQKHKKGQKVNEPGFAKSTSKEEIIKNDYSFLPGRYVGFDKKNVDSQKIKADIKALKKEITNLFAEFQNLSQKVQIALQKSLDFEEEKK